MSAAIALQDVGEPHNKDVGTMRHRTISKSYTQSSVSEGDPWLNAPHDIESSKLPVDTRSFSPTAVYWISPHGMLTKKITILDLSKDISVPQGGRITPEYKEEVRKTLKDHSFTPKITCHRSTWLGLKYTITDDQDNTIAHWTHHWSSVGEATLAFPEDSPHSPHNITLRNKRWGLRTEAFVLNSVPYFWEMDSLWHSTNMTLYRVVGSREHQEKVQVGKYAQKWWGGFVTGGTFVVDEKELDGVVACLSLVVVLKKKRQRAAERHNGGD